MLRYLAAMTHQLAGRMTPLGGPIDQGVHNYVVHMRPLRGAWLDPTDTLHALPDDAAEISDEHVLVGGRAAPVLSRLERQCAGRAACHDLATVSPGRLVRPLAVAGPVVPEPSGGARRGGRILSASTRRRLAHAVPRQPALCQRRHRLHCVGDFDQDELAILARFKCTGYVVPATAPAIAENVAHFYLNQVLERMSSARPRSRIRCWCSTASGRCFRATRSSARPSDCRCSARGPPRIGESDYNRDRLALFVHA